MKKIFDITIIFSRLWKLLPWKLFPTLPDELKDCKFYNVSNESGLSLHVVRCGNDVAIKYQEGKVHKNISVINR